MLIWTKNTIAGMLTRQIYKEFPSSVTRSFERESDCGKLSLEQYREARSKTQGSHPTLINTPYAKAYISAEEKASLARSWFPQAHADEGWGQGPLPPSRQGPQAPRAPALQEVMPVKSVPLGTFFVILLLYVVRGTSSSS